MLSCFSSTIERPASFTEPAILLKTATRACLTCSGRQFRSRAMCSAPWREPETFVFCDYFADFRADLHDIRGDRNYSDCLDPKSYVKSQKLATELLAEGSAGIVYPSVRRSSGTCLVCFRPALVTNVRRNGNVTLTFANAHSPPVISSEIRVPCCGQICGHETNSGRFGCVLVRRLTIRIFRKAPQ
jgi:hypothetical protein